ncbi:MAG: 6-bladed beta-propeller [Candidatus Latescibacteria bacterium]|nr:6-bladed beta-propeller [Candidatus Latescibacterota bacterium]
MTISGFACALFFGLTSTSASSQTEPLDIKNPAKAPRTQVVHLDELWRVGEDDESEAVFGHITDVTADAEQRTYVLDGRMNRVAVFSPEGRFIRTIGQEGEGPGEFRQANGVVVFPGGIVGVLRGQPPALVRFRVSDGFFVDNIYFERIPEHPFQTIVSAKCRGETFALLGRDLREHVDGFDYVYRLMRFDRQGKFLGECGNTVSQFRRGNPVVREQPNILWALAPDGELLVSSVPQYRLVEYGLDCRVQRVITRDYDPRERTNAEKDRIRERYRAVGSQVDVSDHAPDVAWMSIDAAGRTWVMNSRGRVDLPPDSLGVFDVFEPDGRLVSMIDVKGEGNPTKDRYFMVGSRLFVAHPETLAMVAYRVPEFR